MNHTFVGSHLDATKCRQCKRLEVAHGDNAECESCGNIGPCEIIDGDVLACENCQARDKEIKAEVAALGNTRDERVANVKAIMAQNAEVTAGIKILPDVFNAKMVAIVDLAKAIEADPEIPPEQKQFKLAKVLDERYQHLKQVLAGIRKELTEGENEQRAIQQYYNDLAKKLRAEEREQIRLKDVAYQPVEPKVIKKPKSPTTKSVDTKSTMEWATKLETEFPAMKGKVAGALQALVVSKQAASPEAAYNMMKGILSQAKPN